MKRILAVLASLTLLFSLFFGCTASSQELLGTVRVALSSLSGRDRLHLALDGAFSTGEGLTLPQGTEAELSCEDSVLTLRINGNTIWTGSTLVLQEQNVAGAAGLRIREARLPDNHFLGSLSFTASEGTIQTVESLYIEDYLLGILPYEMDERFPLEALKAQAIAARTYAAGKVATNGRIFDVVDTTADQVYLGIPQIGETCRQAVEETRGMILLANGQPAKAYYTASNGGQTESSEGAWGGVPVAYLVVADDPYDLANPEAETREVTLYRSGQTSSPELTALLIRRLAEQTGRQERIAGIEAVWPDVPRRADSRVYDRVIVTLVLENGQRITVALDYFGEVEELCGLSINALDNETLEVMETGDSFRLIARRFGHGVGLSQRGAQMMAGLGQDAEAILRFYYPGTELRQMTFVRSDGVDGCTLQVTANNPLSSVWLLSEARDGAAILDALSAGERVTLISRSSGWSLVQAGLTCGYVRDEALTEGLEYVQKTAETAEKDAASARVRLTDATQILNLRAAPALTAQVIGGLRSGERVELIARYDDWSCVRIDGLLGFVQNEYLDFGDATLAVTSSGATRAVVLPASGAAFYAGPSQDAAVFMHLPQGVTLTLREGSISRGEMTAVSLGGFDGYVPSSALIAVQEESELVALAQTAVPSNAPEVTPTPVPTATADGSAVSMERVATVTASGGLNLRTAPDANAEVLTVLGDGVRIIITGPEEAGFVPVRLGALSGFVSAAHLREEESADKIDENGLASGTRAAVDSRNGLNLRAAPDKDAEVLYVLPHGTVVECIEEAGTYLLVRWGSYEGYVAAQYIRPLSQ